MLEIANASRTVHAVIVIPSNITVMQAPVKGQTYHILYLWSSRKAVNGWL